MNEFETEVWFEYLGPEQKLLVKDAYNLMSNVKAQMSKIGYHDYSFIVFPMAKAYEGFLKKFFYELELIKEYQYKGDHFRIGKALNPDLPKRFRGKEWVWDDLEKLCSRKLADELWLGWKQCRNRLFHFFPHLREGHALDLNKAEKAVEQLRKAMSAAVECEALRRGKQD